MNLSQVEAKIYRLEEILSATNNFAGQNLITEGSSGKIYRGELVKDGNLMKISIRRLNREHEVGDELQTEISMLNRFKNKNNIVRMIGHCEDNNEKIIVYEHAFHGTLDQHLRDPTLTWSQRLQICSGVARALNIIHYDVIHCDISSSKVFLDKDWKPKIYGFEYSTEYPPSWRRRLLFPNRTTPKHDVYSFGELLLEVLCGRKPANTNDFVYENIDKIIDPNLRKQMDAKSLALFKELVLNCLNQEFVQRPTMDQIVKELDDMLEHQGKNPNLMEHLVDTDEGITSKSLMMDFLTIPLSIIKLATKDFTVGKIGSGGYGDVFKAKLEVLNIQSLSSLKGKRKDKLPKIRKTVAIKRMSRADEQSTQGFLTEIELLTSCKHQNIVSFLGYCREADEMILVYEFAFGGSLCDCLTSINLTWAERLKICLGVAHGINYLHTKMEGKPMIIHRDIKSDNILLDKKRNVKVADFGLSTFHRMTRHASTVYTQRVVGTLVYLDPEFLATGNYKRASDIYSFGVVLFEILCGRMAYDMIFLKENNNGISQGLAPVARRRFIEGTIKELMDPRMIEGNDHIFILNGGPNQESFNIFSNIAYECLAETQAKRPTMEVIIRTLEKALKLQGEAITLPRFRLNDIKSATKDFDETYCLGLYTNGVVYKAELDYSGNNDLLLTKRENNSEPTKKHGSVAIKRFTGENTMQVRQESFAELEMLTSSNHSELVSLLGFCDEGDEMILVYDYFPSNRSLADHLQSIDGVHNLTWTHRLHMCLEIARGLKYLYTKVAKHGNINSSNIIFDKYCHAKLAYFGIFKLHSVNQAVRAKVYEDPEYRTSGKMETESDVYSFGVVLFEILCGKLAYDPVHIKVNDKGLAPIARQCFKDGTIEKLIDPKLKEENCQDNFSSVRGPNQDSLETFSKVAYQCLGEAAQRPSIEIVIDELERALDFHVSQYS